MGGLCECITTAVRKGLIDYVLGINSFVMKPLLLYRNAKLNKYR